MCLEQNYFLWISANYISGTMASSHSGYTAPSDAVPMQETADGVVVTVPPQDMKPLPLFCLVSVPLY